MKYFFDIETTSLDIEKAKITYVHIIDSDGFHHHRILPDKKDLLELFSKKGVYVGHNVIGYDNRIIERDSGINLDNKCIDTFVTSRLMDYSKFKTHSIEEIGEYLGIPKAGTDIEDWSDPSPEIIERCVSDVLICGNFYVKDLEKFVNDPRNKDALRTEHNVASFFNSKQYVGFRFDTRSADHLKNSLEVELKELERNISKLDKTVPIKEPLAYKKDGNLTVRSKNKIENLAMEGARNLKIDGGFLTGTRIEKFNPASHKQRIEVLNAEGWEPVERTDTYIRKKIMREEISPELEATAWKVNETNLATLPDTASLGVKSLAQWVYLASLKSSLEEYTTHTNSDGILKGNIFGIGAWSHRSSHTKPNLANIVKGFKGEPKNAVERIKAKYNGQIRKLFKSPQKYLVGVDAKSIQLRVLAHYVNDKEFTKQVLSGDIHDTNQKLLHSVAHCKDRDTAKTFIYAWVLGAAAPKIADILGCNIKEARAAVTKFEETWDLTNLNKFLDKGERDGGFYALDGRFVKQKHRRLLLAGMLQSGESIIMKKIISSIKDKPGFRLCAYVHDEFQFASEGTYYITKKIILNTIVRQITEELKLNCPIELDYSEPGSSWAETH